MTVAPTNGRNNSLFNASMKEMFLSEMIENKTIAQETAKSYHRIFNVTAEKEEELGKDLNQFNVEEMEEILFSFNASNRNTVESYARIISSYLNWSVKKGYTSANVLEGFRPNDFERYLKNEEIYFTDKQLKRWEDRCVNAQDAVIPRLLFAGVCGNRMSEIRNLKKNDLDKDRKKLKLTNTLEEDEDGIPTKFTTRWIDVDDRTIEMIEEASEAKIYHKRNGNVAQTEKNNIRTFTDLVKNDYIVRASITKSSEANRPVDKFVIYRRIEMLAEEFGLERFTTKTIQRSGMMHYVNKLVENGEISLNDVKMVADQFNIKSYHNLKGFITMENLLKTYPREKEKVR